MYLFCGDAMGIAERKNREKEQRRNTILDAAEKVIFTSGFESSTMDEVAEAAELSKGTIYLYFKSKEDLYMGIFLRGQSLLHKFFLDAYNENIDKKGIDQIMAIGNAYFDYMHEYRDYCDTVLHFGAKKHEDDLHGHLKNEGMEKAAYIHNIMFRAIENGMKDGSIRNDLDPTALVLLLEGQSTGMFQFLINFGDKMSDVFGISPQTLKSEHMKFIKYALTPKEKNDS